MGIPGSENNNPLAGNNGRRPNSATDDKRMMVKVGWTPREADEYVVTYLKQEGDKNSPPSVTNKNNKFGSGLLMIKKAFISTVQPKSPTISPYRVAYTTIRSKIRFISINLSKITKKAFITTAVTMITVTVLTCVLTSPCVN